MSKAKTTTEATPEVLTKIRVSFGASFSFEFEGRESIGMDAYRRALSALIAVTTKEKPRHDSQAQA